MAENDGWQVVTRRRPDKKAKGEDADGEQPTEYHQSKRGAAGKKSRRPNAVPQVEKTPVITAEELEDVLGKTELQYAKPHRRDDIFRTARDIIIDENRVSLVTFTDPLRVEALETTATSYSGSESNTSTLIVIRKNFHREILLKLSRVGIGPARRTILLCQLDDETWIDFKDYLTSLPSPTHSIGTGKRGTEAQKNWWSKNGKTFNLLSLPDELRLEIYRHYYPHKVYPKRMYDGRFKFGRGSEDYADQNSGIGRYRIHDHTHDIAEKPDSALMRACKQVFAESEEFLWKDTIKAFPTASCCYFWTKHELGDPAVFNKLRRLELDMSHREYIYLFKVDVAPFREPRGIFDDRRPFFGKDGIAEGFKELKCVHEFIIRFASPFDAMQTDAWGGMGQYNGYSSWYFDWNGNRDGDGYQTSCQKTIVDWILTFAKEHIQHFPVIHLAGAVKNSTKLKFDAIFADEKKGIHHGMTAAKAVVENWPRNNLPPPCHCTTPCRHTNFREVVHKDSYCRHRDCRHHYGVGRLKKMEKMLREYRFDFDD